MPNKDPARRRQTDREYRLRRDQAGPPIRPVISRSHAEMARIIGDAVNKPMRAVVEAAIGLAFLHHLDGTDTAFQPGAGAGIFQNYQTVMSLHRLQEKKRSDHAMGAIEAAQDPTTDG